MTYYKPYNDKPGKHIACNFCKRKKCTIHKFAKEGTLSITDAEHIAKGCRNWEEDNE